MKQNPHQVRDEKLVARVRSLLKSIPSVEEKKMFGSIAFLVRGRICVSARSERIMCRIDPAAHEAALKRQGSRTVVMKGREYRGYIYVNAESLKTKRALQDWIDLALTYNEAKNEKAAKPSTRANAATRRAQL